MYIYIHVPLNTALNRHSIKDCKGLYRVICIIWNIKFIYLLKFNRRIIIVHCYMLFNSIYRIVIIMGVGWGNFQNSLYVLTSMRFSKYNQILLSGFSLYSCFFNGISCLTLWTFQRIIIIIEKTLQIVLLFMQCKQCKTCTLNPKGFTNYRNSSNYEICGMPEKIVHMNKNRSKRALKHMCVLLRNTEYMYLLFQLILPVRMTHLP